MMQLTEMVNQRRMWLGRVWLEVEEGRGKEFSCGCVDPEGK